MSRGLLLKQGALSAPLLNFNATERGTSFFENSIHTALYLHYFINISLRLIMNRILVT